MLGGLSFMLRGLPFLYQGQELGLENVQFTDIFSGGRYQHQR